MTPIEIFGDSERLNKFYSDLAKISDMAISKHANLLLSHIINQSALFAYEHREILTKLADLGNSPTDQVAKPECPGALDEEVQEEQKNKLHASEFIPDGPPDSDCPTVNNSMPNCC